MNFKQWLLEYEGNTFNQADAYRNPQDGPVDSKYYGKSDGHGKEIGGRFSKIDKEFGMKSDDPMLKIQKLMRKMKKKMVK